MPHLGDLCHRQNLSRPPEPAIIESTYPDHRENKTKTTASWKSLTKLEPVNPLTKVILKSRKQKHLETFNALSNQPSVKKNDKLQKSWKTWIMIQPPKKPQR